MKRLAVLVLAALALTVPAAAVAVADAAPRKNLVQTAASAPQFSTLVKAIKAAGLVSALSGKTKLTVFAPTNAAFAKVPKKTLRALLKDRARLRAVLLYHVVKGSVPARKVVTLRSARTLEGSRVHIRVRQGRVYVNRARVTRTDIRASNGIVHVINRVLIPPRG